MTKQPKWKFLANLGDVNPLLHGGFFVYVDETGVYPPEAEVLEPSDDSDNPVYTVYRFILERCTYQGGILSDNPSHPSFPAWFAQPESRKAERPQDSTYLSNVCGYADITYDELVALFCSEDPLARARAYRYIGEYHGYDELDHYPLNLRRREARKRYRERNDADYSV